MSVGNWKYRFGSVTYDLSSRTHIMGILNVTPDSFSDGGLHFRVDDAVKRGLLMIDEGADFIDVGGESTRPGAEDVSIDEELIRVIPVIEKLSKHTHIPISIDTYKSEVAKQALEAGAVIVNDITGLQFDSHMPEVIASMNARVVLMHIQGTPKTMQENPLYKDVIEDICSYLRKSIQTAEKNNIEQLIIDPGIGFGKTLENNLEIIQRLNEFHRFHYPVLVGPSRKSFLGKILNLPANERLEGTSAAVAVSIMKGANIVRVHDVKEMKRVANVVDAIQSIHSMKMSQHDQSGNK
ncbi:MAG: dihydropteroate synthase [Ignavibacteriae bacterium]|nr:dihydropteroate synthase [Ignavibacteriota bacterium]